MAGKMQSVVAFDVPKEVPHRVLTAATEAGLAAARGVLPEGDALEAIGRLQSAGASRRVLVELRFQMRLAAPVAALAAERAFRDAFAHAISARGFTLGRA